MKIEDIEKAAQDYDDDLIYSSISEQYNVIKAFKAAAEWRINSVWHNADEVPKEKGYILVEVNGSQPIFVTWNINVIPTNWDKIVKENNVVKWAYVKDLIPIMED
jgi:hypothetical protein|nr:MAG TPA: hypothetical protein [Caudoviricetes sp.]